MSARKLLVCVFILLLVPALRADEESDRQAKMEQLKKDYHDWYQQIHDLRRWYDEDTDKIREAICSEDEAKIEETTLNVADRISGEISTKYDSLNSEGSHLQDRAGELQTGATASDASRLRDKVQQILRSIQRAKDGIFRGSANPRLRSRIEYGKRAHKDMQDSCAAKEVSIESSYCSDSDKAGGCRIDCVNVSSHTCKIIEIKPKNDRAERLGTQQLRLYVDGLQRKFADRKAAAFQGTVFEQCIEGDRLNLDSELAFYQFCPVNREEVVEPLDSEVSE